MSSQSSSTTSRPPANGVWAMGEQRACVRAAFLAVDREALQRNLVSCAALGLTAPNDGGAAPAPQLIEEEAEVAMARAFAALLDGTGLPAELEPLAARAAGAKLAAPVVELCALRAFFALEAGDDRGGLLLARRASLMARSEAIPEVELLANLVLARARRLNRQPHLALRILEAVDRLAPPSWRLWLDWERTFAAGPWAAGLPQGGPAASVVGLLAAAAAGDVAQFWAHAQAVCAATVAAPLRRDALLLVAALAPDPSDDAAGLLRATVDPAPRATVADWRYGAVALPPPALHGLAAGRLDSEDEVVAGEHEAAYVVMSPGRRSFRCLRVGLPLLRGPQLARLRPSTRLHGRTATLLAILALAGASGLDDATCFTRTYGFAYVPDLHRGVFDVLLHRARIAVQGAARLERASGRIALSATRPLLVPDPCTSQSMSDRVLRFLAEQGRASAKQAAEGLGVSLRAVQGALTALSEADACVIERQGRHVTYAIEDSVFSEPTRRLAEHGSTLVSVEGVARGG